MSDASPVRITRSGALATVTLTRSEVHNAFNQAVIAELTRIFQELAMDHSVHAVILEGEGKSFSAGADLNWMRSMIDYSHAENVEDAHRLAAMFNAIDRCPKPVIGRIQGAAMGGGAGLAAVVDIAIATESCRFAFSEVRLGIVPAVISPFVIRRIGETHARRYFLTGERFDGKRAVEIGLVSEAVPADQIDARIAAILKQLEPSAPGAVSCAKRLVFEVTESPAEAALLTAEMIADRRSSDEGQDGMKAFLEKRNPGWIVEGGRLSRTEAQA